MKLRSGGSATSKTPPRWKRTRSGCLLCRSRRRKCDGTRPRCRSCEIRGTACQWGLKASFHSSRNYTLSRREVEALIAIEEQRSPPLPHDAPPIIINETNEIIRDYCFSNDVSSPVSIPDTSVLQDEAGDNVEDQSVVDAATVLTTLDRPGDSQVEETPSRTDISFISGQFTPQQRVSDTGEAVLNGHLSVNSLLCQSHPYVFSHQADSPSSNSSHPSIFNRPITHNITDCPPPFSLGQAIAETGSLSPEPSPPISNAERIHLVSCFMQETGTWCETTDSDMHFTVRSLHVMMESPVFAAAAVALASRQLDHVENQQQSVTLELYQYAVQLLLRQDPEKTDASVLAACTLLCVYEMMASGVHEWRRHLKGCAGLLQVKKWNGSSQGIVKSCFWAFARIDVWAAFISGKTTLIPTDFWLDDRSVESLAEKGDVDDYCNLAILIFAQIVNLLATSKFDKTSFRSTLTESVIRLWNDLQTWRRLRPPEVCPLLRDSCTASKVFPTTIFTRSSSVCGNTFYHTGSILLLQTGLLFNTRRLTSSLLDTNQRDHVWHAREIAGISISNPSHANWVNQLQPLYIAGTIFSVPPSMSSNPTVSPGHRLPLSSQFMTNSPRRSRLVNDLPSMAGVLEDYSTEKILILKQLARIERETGWKTSDRAADLRELWGFA